MNAEAFSRCKKYPLFNCGAELVANKGVHPFHGSLETSYTYYRDGSINRK